MSEKFSSAKKNPNKETNKKGQATIFTAEQIKLRTSEQNFWKVPILQYRRFHVRFYRVTKYENWSSMYFQYSSIV